ncbi:CD48 antigen-like [Oreochromis aureus]|uniref:CD48 antigen-like n=1 Tax=Oreochromis aureus TaxID=47969 RepID=UPI00195315B3|nr:CD48 antigen-like [Oreochromis aureus]
MKTSAGFWLLAVLLVAATSFSQTVEKYFKVGGTLQLSPQPVSAEITSILWKYDKNLLADWEKGLIDLTYYSKFKGRTTLNTTTGVLEIRDMTAEDSGLYSVEINYQVQSQVYQTVEIEAVPKPVVDVQPLSCSSASPNCKLVCWGDVNKAGPVEYFWKKDDGEWVKSEKNTKDIINDKETQRVEKFSCRIKNLFSEKESSSLPNPFFRQYHH